MVEETVHHELETLQKLVLELTSREPASAALLEQFESRLEAKAELLKVAGVGRHEKALLRIEAIEKTYETFKEDLNRVPTSLDREIKRLTELFDEKLASTQANIITLRDFTQAMRDTNKMRLDAEFAAAKELTSSYNSANAAAVAKSEAALTKEIDSLKGLIGSTSKAFDTQIDNLTDRLNRSDGMFAGGKGAGAAALSVLTVVILAGSLFFAMHNNGPGTVGADTKRVDDLIAVIAEQNRQATARMDALSARINALTPPRP